MDKSPARVPPHLHRCSTIAVHGSHFPFPTSGTPLPPAVSKVWYLVISAIGGWEGGGGGHYLAMCGCLGRVLRINLCRTPPCPYTLYRPSPQPRPPCAGAVLFSAFLLYDLQVRGSVMV